MNYILNEDDIKYIKTKKENPSYWSVLPAIVRYSKYLKPNEKLLYSEITALSNKNGFCHAQNKYFSELYNVEKSTISRWISNLQKHNFIRVIIQRDEKNQIISRKIYPKSDILNQQIIDSPTYINSNSPINNIIDSPPDKKVEDNNTSINIIKYNNPISFVDKEETKEIIKHEQEFDFFWDKYHKKIERPKTDKHSAIKYWNKLKKKEKAEAINKIADYAKTIDDVRYSKKAYTYLRDKVFLDEFNTIKQNQQNNGFTIKRQFTN